MKTEGITAQPRQLKEHKNGKRKISLIELAWEFLNNSLTHKFMLLAGVERYDKKTKKLSSHSRNNASLGVLLSMFLIASRASFTAVICSGVNYNRKWK